MRKRPTTTKNSQLTNKRYRRRRRRWACE